jgi:RNA polymerase sigma-70 factor (ECF subfamily)
MINGDSIATRHSLLTRLKDWTDQDSWRDFFETYWRLIYGLALKAGLTEAEAQDVVQEVVIETAKKIGTFKYDRKVGSFKSWLRQLTRWRIRDQLRKRRREHLPLPSPLREEGTATDEYSQWPHASEIDPDWDEEWRKNLLDAAGENLRKLIPPRHYQVFDLHVRRGLSVPDIARLTGISPAGVYVIKFRTLGLLRKEMRRLEKELI